jgi:long-subunit acyl-CoA synthetase (AMP-forming)
MAEDGLTEILERNKRGELWVRAQNVMKGYWHNLKATKETKTADGWLRTGDIAYVDDQGKFHVVDRMKVSSSAVQSNVENDSSSQDPLFPMLMRFCCRS